MIDDLSDDLLLRILSHSTLSTLHTAAQCNRRLHGLITLEDTMWEGVLVSTLSGRPMTRLIPSSWRSELFLRKQEMDRWAGWNSELQSFGEKVLLGVSIPNGLGQVLSFRTFPLFLIFITEKAVLRVLLPRWADHVKQKEHLKKSVFYYSTMFSPSALLSCACFREKTGMVFGFSDGSIVVIDGLPERDWSDTNFYTLCGPGGPPVIKMESKSKYLLALAQRQQSEVHCTMSLFDLKVKNRLQQSTHIESVQYKLDDCGRIRFMSAEVPSDDAIMGSVGDVLIGHKGLYASDYNCKISISKYYIHQSDLILQTAENELTLFSTTRLMITNKVKFKCPIIDFAADNVIICVLLALNRILIVDVVGGNRIAERPAKLNDTSRIMAIIDHTVYISSSRQLLIWHTYPAVNKQLLKKATKVSSKKKKKLDIDQKVKEERSEMNFEEREEERIERLRGQLNITGLTEEEMIQYAQLLSLE